MATTDQRCEGYSRTASSSPCSLFHFSPMSFFFKLSSTLIFETLYVELSESMGWASGLMSYSAPGTMSLIWGGQSEGRLKKLVSQAVRWVKNTLLFEEGSRRTDRSRKETATSDGSRLRT